MMRAISYLKVAGGGDFEWGGGARQPELCVALERR